MTVAVCIQLFERIRVWSADRKFFGDEKSGPKGEGGYKLTGYL